MAAQRYQLAPCGDVYGSDTDTFGGDLSLHKGQGELPFEPEHSDHANFSVVPKSCTVEGSRLYIPPVFAMQYDQPKELRVQGSFTGGGRSQSFNQVVPFGGKIDLTNGSPSTARDLWDTAAKKKTFLRNLRYAQQTVGLMPDWSVDYPLTSMDASDTTDQFSFSLEIYHRSLEWLFDPAQSLAAWGITVDFGASFALQHPNPAASIIDDSLGGAGAQDADVTVFGLPLRVINSGMTVKTLSVSIESTWSAEEWNEGA